MHKKTPRFLCCLTLILCSGIFSHALRAKEITDMYGNKVTVPDKITRVYSINPSAALMLYAIDPNMLVGLSMPVLENQQPFFSKSYRDLPVLGGASGNGLNLNLELMLQVKPDILIVWGDDAAYGKKGADSIRNLNIPVVAVDVNGLSRYANTFVFLGKLLNREKRANELAAYTSRTLGEVKSLVSGIPVSKRLSVYNTRMKDGLNTACESSLHGELIPMAGGINPVKCFSGVFTGIEKINMEQVLVMNPDVIVSMDASFAKNVYQDERWQGIRAVRSKRVYLTPTGPLNWFDGPPSLMGILGLQWLTKNLYPDLYRKDIEKEARNFIRLFFGIDLPKETIQKILHAN